jgi:dihydrofolate reductase
MATISVLQNLTLDGVMQAPGGKDEDTRGGFSGGGWSAGYTDEVAGQLVAEGLASTGALLFGHRTYSDLLDHWTTTPEPNPFAEALLQTQKYVVSRDAATELTYPASTLLSGEAVETVAGLRDRVEGTLTIMGSGELIRSLQPAGLIDHYLLLIHPIVLGSGQRMFAEGRSDLELRRATTTKTGLIVAEYAAR